MKENKKIVRYTFQPSSYLKNYKLLVFLGPFFKALEALCEVFSPFFMAKIIDIGIKNNDKPYRNVFRYCWAKMCIYYK